MAIYANMNSGGSGIFVRRAPTLGGERQDMIFLNILKLNEIKEKWPWRRHVPYAPLVPPLMNHNAKTFELEAKFRMRTHFLDKGLDRWTTIVNDVFIFSEQMFDKRNH